MPMVEGHLRSGKVRDLYELPEGRLLMVASDRMSAFDVVLPTEIPDKGRVLTALSRWWFAELGAIVPNHLISTDVDALRDPPIERDELRGRSMIVVRAEVLPIEAVVRGYLAGSGWKAYRDHGSIGGVDLPSGLRESDRLSSPIFTPATKAEVGEHDENIDFDTVVTRVGGDLAEQVRDIALRLYGYAAAVSARSGILLADTKFEFGIRADTGALILVDEVLTPDSSRFWDVTAYEPGRSQASFDKQFVRDWLEAQPWDKTAPGPALPDDIVTGTRGRYIEAYERITGARFDRYLREDVIAR